jgi:hypothetical protein
LRFFGEGLRLLLEILLQGLLLSEVVLDFLARLFQFFGQL